jgi:hypothetical protein
MRYQFFVLVEGRTLTKVHQIRRILTKQGFDCSYQRGFGMLASLVNRPNGTYWFLMEGEGTPRKIKGVQYFRQEAVPVVPSAASVESLERTLAFV